MESVTIHLEQVVNENRPNKKWTKWNFMHVSNANGIQNFGGYADNPAAAIQDALYVLGKHAKPFNKASVTIITAHEQ